MIGALGVIFGLFLGVIGYVIGRLTAQRADAAPDRLVHDRDGIRVYRTDDGCYVVADAAGWVPGVYGSVETAVWAVGVWARGAASG